MKHWEACTHKERIERWENAIRVLQDLSPHEKRKHWDMSTWGMKTDCGTVGCAAGQCGLDPWFRRRGLKLDFHLTKENDSQFSYYRKFDIENVDRFFGWTGSINIFFHGRRRPVGMVIREMKTYLKSLKNDTALRDGIRVRRFGD